MPLNYLGPNIGQAQQADTLSSGAPGTVPAAIPGVTPPGATGQISPTGAIIPSRPVISQPGAPLPPALAGAIQGGAPGGAPPPQAQTPADIQYTTETQADGTVLLRLQNPDGTPGPVVKVISVKSQPGAGRPR